MNRTTKRLLAGVAAAVIAVSAMGASIASPTYAVVPAANIQIDGSNAAVIDCSIEGIALTDIYGVTFSIAALPDAWSGNGGVVIQADSKPFSDDWNHEDHTWGNTEGVEISIKDNAITYTSTTPLFAATDTRGKIYLQNWWSEDKTNVTVLSADLLDAEGKSLTEKETEGGEGEPTGEGSPVTVPVSTDPYLTYNVDDKTWEFTDFSIFAFPNSKVRITYTDANDYWDDIGFGLTADGEWKSTMMSEPAGESCDFITTIGEILDECGVIDPSTVSYGKIEGYNGCVIENVSIEKIEESEPEPVVDPGTEIVPAPVNYEKGTVTVAVAGNETAPATASAPALVQPIIPNDSDKVEHSALKYHNAKGAPVIWQSADDAVIISWGSINKAEKYSLYAYDYDRDDVRLLLETNAHSVQIRGLALDTPYAYIIVPMIDGEWVEPSEDDVLMFYIVD